MEYYEAPFTISDSIYGTTFFMTTGLHGVHVIIGTLALTVAFIRLANYHYTKKHHLGLESAILY
jgi:cytochrome c oxidase subunit 3